ncbi:hypothetical protein J6590_082789 [Homalodisca vitripennis]|nr:hypothetical protein J6590_082789 [Homalodisca vitripennis]
MYTLEGAVAEAVSQFNFGNSVFSLSMSAAGVSPGRFSGRIINIRDKKRVTSTVRKNNLHYKRYRRNLKLKKQRLEDKKKKKEGPTYGAGNF